MLRKRLTRNSWPRSLATLATGLVTIAGGMALVTASPAHAAGSQFYVSCDNNAARGDGSSGNPWNTLSSVNGHTFGAGDQILFNRGTTCNGSLKPQGSGASGSPIVIDTYGTGAKPIIAGGGTTDAVLLSNQQYWEIRNLEITNNGATTASRRGVHIVLQDYGTGNYYRLTNLTIHDVNGDSKKDLQASGGIQFDVLGTSVKTKFNDVVLDGNEVYNVNRYGINMSSTWRCRGSIGYESTEPTIPNLCTTGVDTYYPWTGFIARNNTVHEVGGDGIVLQYTQNGLAEHNVAYNTANNDANASNAGIWAWNADHVTFQYNEAYKIQKLAHNGDGMAWDADYGSDGTLYQYNYSHDNGGGMAMFCGDCGPAGGSASNAIFRYNVSQNDGSQIVRDAGQTNGAFYNNTIYLPAGSNAAILQNGHEGLTFANNIVVNNGTGGWDYSNANFQNNLLWGNVSNVPPGQIIADPKLASAGNGGNGFASAAAYKLTTGSPAIGAGRPMPDNGGKDFWGDAVPRVCAPDIGADQFSSPNDATCGVQNSGFESGSLSPWYGWNNASVVAGNAHSGANAVQLGSSPASAEQVIPVTPNTTYTVSGWAKTTTAGDEVHIGVKNYDGQETWATFTGTNYTNGSVVIHTGPNATQATVYCYKPTGSGNGYCDDITAVASTPPASMLKGVASGRCADDPARSTTDGTQFALYTCMGAANQTFNAFSDGTFRIMDKCLTAASSTSATPVTISTCTATLTGQRWTYDPTTLALSTYTNMCMDANAAGTGNGTQLIIYGCSGHTNQQWTKS